MNLMMVPIPDYVGKLGVGELQFNAQFYKSYSETYLSLI